MSFIRCWTNPEGLYVWDDINGYVAIAHTLNKPFCSFNDTKFVEDQIQVPRREFYGVCKQWDNSSYKTAKYKDFSAEEVEIFDDNGEIVPEDYDYLNPTHGRKTSYRIKVQYKKEFVYLWRVTWEYVVKNAVKDRNWKKK